MTRVITILLTKSRVVRKNYSTIVKEQDQKRLLAEHNFLTVSRNSWVSFYSWRGVAKQIRFQLIRHYLFRISQTFENVVIKYNAIEI